MKRAGRKLRKRCDEGDNIRCTWAKASRLSFDVLLIGTNIAVFMQFARCQRNGSYPIRSFYPISFEVCL